MNNNFYILLKFQMSVILRHTVCNPTVVYTKKREHVDSTYGDSVLVVAFVPQIRFFKTPHEFHVNGNATFCRCL